MSSESPIAGAIQKLVDAEALAGAVALVWRGGAEADFASVGWRDRDAGAPMARDTIFRVASMSKPITSAAALTLLEEGRFTLDEPITRWAPEFENMHVLRSPSGRLDDTAPAERPITFEYLLTHRSGLTYGSFHLGALAEAYGEALGPDIDTPVPPNEWISRLAALPLIDQPGAGFHYGHSTDLLGLLLGRMEGASLGEVLRRRVFEPLGMTDTGFVVPPQKRGRCAVMYGFDAEGRLTPRAEGAGGAFMAERPDHFTYESGGAGLWSTIDDYLAFARIFVEDGGSDGRRLLRPETLALMTANRMSAEQRAKGEMLGMPLFAGHGFGLGLAVVTDPEKAAPTQCKGGVGTVGWPGAYGGWWQADPTDGSVMIFLSHRNAELEQLGQGIGLGVYEAITEFHRLASAQSQTSS